MNSLSGLKRLWVGVGLGLLLTALVAASVAAETIVQPLSGGGRSVSVTSATMSPITYSHDAQTSSGTVTLAVDDSSGTGQGWNVTVQSAGLEYSGEYNGAPIPAQNLAITSAGAPATTAGQGIDSLGGPKVPDTNATGSLDQPRKVLQANPEYGQGSYSQSLDLSLTVPAMSRAGAYSGVLIVSINSGP